MISPFLGKILQSGLRPQYLIICGFAMSAIFGYLMSGSNLESGSPNFFIALLCRGVGAALLIVPLTALAVSELKPADIPQGAALNNMMRQMGGSFGIALINTFIAQRAAANRTALIANVTSTDPGTAARIQAGVTRFMSYGATYWQAFRQAIGALEATVVRQTYLMSYMNAFLLLAILNAACIPLVIVTILKKRTAPKSNAPVVVSDH
jgi:DHA2 family multidrug resistance protein